MRRLIRDVSLGQSEGLINQLLTNLSGENGQMWLHLLDEFLKEKRTLSPKWIEELKREVHWDTVHLQNFDLWFACHDWPFQITEFKPQKINEESFGKIRKFKSAVKDEVLTKFKDEKYVTAADRYGATENTHRLLRIQLEWLFPNFKKISLWRIIKSIEDQQLPLPVSFCSNDIPFQLISSRDYIYGNTERERRTCVIIDGLRDQTKSVDLFWFSRTSKEDGTLNIHLSNINTDYEFDTKDWCIFKYCS